MASRYSAENLKTCKLVTEVDPISNTWTWDTEFEIVVDLAPVADTGWVLIDYNKVNKIDLIHYHRKSWNTLYYYRSQRDLLWLWHHNVVHEVGASVRVHDVAEFMNHIYKNINELWYVKQYWPNEIVVFGGDLWNPTTATRTTVADTAITWLANGTHYLYIDFNDWIIKTSTTVPITHTYHFATVVVASSIITSIQDKRAVISDQWEPWADWKDVELQVDWTMLQWKYTDSEVWINLYEIPAATWWSIWWTFSNQTDLNKLLVWPSWHMLNWKIVTSVASNNLTVAIKTLAWTDPSAWDPVYIRIWDTLRTITWALSITMNAWTNRFNSGSSELATKDVDYFVYLGWKTSSSEVIIWITRIPSGNLYSDFNWTSTNEKHMATNSTPASSDVVELVWRFNAILSATASFNWSISWTSIVISRPIYETRLLERVPTKTTWGSMTITNGWVNTPLYRYKIRDNMIYVSWQEVLTLWVSWHHSIDFTPPMDVLRSPYSEDHWYTGSWQYANWTLTSCTMNSKSWGSPKIWYRNDSSVNSGNFVLWTYWIRFAITYPVV